jgi:hypothetical protein
MQRDGSTRYRKGSPYATPPGRRVIASARRMQRDGSTRYRKRPPYATPPGQRVIASARRMRRDGPTRYRKGSPYATPPGRRVTASALRMQRDGSTRYRKGSTRYRKGSLACNASRPCVTASTRGMQRDGSTRYRKESLACNASRPCVTACPGRKTASGSCVTASPGINTASGSCVDVRALRMMRPDAVKRLLILPLLNHLHHLHLVHHFNKLFQPGSSRPALPRYTSFFLNGAGCVLNQDTTGGYPCSYSWRPKRPFVAGHLDIPPAVDRDVAEGACRVDGAFPIRDVRRTVRNQLLVLHHRLQSDGDAE